MKNIYIGTGRTTRVVNQPRTCEKAFYTKKKKNDHCCRGVVEVVEALDRNERANRLFSKREKKEF